MPATRCSPTSRTSNLGSANQRPPKPFKPGPNPIRNRKPGPGRPKSIVRQAYLAGADQAAPVLINFVHDPTLSPSERIYASSILCRYGLGEKMEVEDTTPQRRPTYDELLARIAERLPRLIAILPLERCELARLFQERQEIDRLLAERSRGSDDPTLGGEAV